MQNIALIINTLQGGGAERCAADLSLIFTEKGFQVYIFTDLSTRITYEYAGALVDYRFDLLIAEKMSDEDWLRQKVKQMKELKILYKIDLAISFMQYANYFNILSKGREKVILTTHSVNSEYAKYEKSAFWSEETFRELYQFADLITFPSDYCREDWLRHYGDKNHITRTVYNPVHLMEAPEKKDKRNVVITVGRMHGIKRQWHLIKSFKLVKEMCPDSRLILLGEGELRPKLEEIIEQYDLADDVEMPGNVNNVQDYLAQAKVFAMTSRCEAMPCSVLEALSAGVPVVACDTPGGIREELGIARESQNAKYPLRGECGIITPYIEDNDIDDISEHERAMANEIVRLLKEDALREEMAAAAVRMAERFKPDTIGNVWIEDIFRSCPCAESDQDAYERIRERHLHDYRSPVTINVKMYVSYYRLLEKWMVLREKGGSTEQYFMAHDINTIMIYGLGKMADHLLADLRGSSIHIVCAIDMRAINKYGDFRVLTPEERLPNADCIVITPVHEAESIKQKLEGKTMVPILSLSEILDECV